jgi:hypothetical protein
LASGFGLGGAQPGRPLRILRSCWPLGLPGGQEGEGPNRPKSGSLWALGSWGQRDLARQDEPIERRPEEQRAQDAHENQLGTRLFAAVVIETPSHVSWPDPPLGGFGFGLGVVQPGCRAAAQGGAQAQWGRPRLSGFDAVAGQERLGEGLWGHQLPGARARAK